MNTLQVDGFLISWEIGDKGGSILLPSGGRITLNRRRSKDKYYWYAMRKNPTASSGTSTHRQIYLGVDIDEKQLQRAVRLLALPGDDQVPVIQDLHNCNLIAIKDLVFSYQQRSKNTRDWTIANRLIKDLQFLINN